MSGTRHMETGGRARKVLLSLLIVGMAGGLAGVGTMSAFSSDTQSPGNTFAAGTVYVSDSDGGTAAMYAASNRKPLQPVESCIKVTYQGTLDATMKLYTLSTIGSLGQYVDLTVEKGTSSGNPTFPGCGVFTSQATIFTGTLAAFASTKNSYANGVSAFPGSATKWVADDTLVYRFTLSLQDDANANGGLTPLTSGAHEFKWEARAQ